MHSVVTFLRAREKEKKMVLPKALNIYIYFAMEQQPNWQIISITLKYLHKIQNIFCIYSFLFSILLKICTLLAFIVNILQIIALQRHEIYWMETLIWWVLKYMLCVASHTYTHKYKNTLIITWANWKYHKIFACFDCKLLIIDRIHAETLTFFFIIEFSHCRKQTENQPFTHALKSMRLPLVFLMQNIQISLVFFSQFFLYYSTYSFIHILFDRVEQHAVTRW